MHCWTRATCCSERETHQVVTGSWGQICGESDSDDGGAAVHLLRLDGRKAVVDNVGKFVGIAHAVGMACADHVVIVGRSPLAAVQGKFVKMALPRGAADADVGTNSAAWKGFAQQTFAVAAGVG